MLLAALLLAGPAAAVTLPAGFQDTIVAGGLVQPTAIALAADGRLFVAEKSGLIKVFDGPGDATPDVFADLRTNVHNFWDRGLLGMALHPDFPATPYVYVSYTLDAAIGGTPPRWGSAGATADPCPSPPGATASGCVVGGRLSRLQAAGNAMVGSEQVLLEGWCQQFPSHSVGDVAFGDDGALYVSAGDGASFHAVDYGQSGTPLNPCGDPPGGEGSALHAPTARGGALRAQSARRPSGEPAVLNGTVLRLDPVTGQALPDNPLVGSGIGNGERIIAYGLRNPFRLALRPGTREVYVGDVGWSAYDEIDRIADTADAVVENFGWPCYEGPGIQVSYQAAQLDLCRSLYQQPGGVASPLFAYAYGTPIVAGESCSNGSNSISGLAFYQGGGYPTAYTGALFFADYARGCIWSMPAGADGRPDPALRASFASGTSGVVDLTIGPGGDLYYAEFTTGTVHRVRFFADAQPPIAVASSDVSNGPLPLSVSFDASASHDADPGDVLRFAWDLDGDGDFDDSTDAAPQYVYTAAATVAVRVRVTDSYNLSATASLVIDAGNSAPQVTILSPAPTTQWAVGDLLTLSGTATDAEDGPLPSTALSWSVVMHHCPQDCHQHPVQEFPATDTAMLVAPDHEYPSHLELRLTATDSGGLQTTVSRSLFPATVVVHLDSAPPGLALAIGSEVAATPFQRTVIVGSAQSISAPAPQSLGGSDYLFASWSDGGAQTHTVVAPAASLALVATFAPVSGSYCGDGVVDPGEECDDGGTVDGDCCDATCAAEPGPSCGAVASATPTGTPHATPTPTATPPTNSFIAGALRYFRGDRPLPGIVVDLSGPLPASAVSDTGGAYDFGPLAAGAWTVAPRGASASRMAVTALDAAYVLQHLAGTRVLDADQQLAADVTADGVLDELDAARILEFAVGSLDQFAGAACGSDLLYLPAAAPLPNQSSTPPAVSPACQPGALAFTPLDGPAPGQSFRAVRLGDCTGNLQP
jgi:cysteine-rich repeat protein